MPHFVFCYVASDLREIILFGRVSVTSTLDIQKGVLAMATFLMLTRLSPDAIRSPKSLEDLERKAMERIRAECPSVKWMTNYAILGPYDYLDIFQAPDTETAFKVATLIRTLGHAQTEVWSGMEWAKFKDMVRHLPGGEV